MTNETERIDGLDEIDPPDTLVTSVMSRIAEQPTTVGRWSGGRVMANKAFWGIAAAAAVLIVVGLVVGYPPVGKGIEGTIGAAKRYQAEQIKKEDVKTTDGELQAFL